MTFVRSSMMTFECGPSGPSMRGLEGLTEMIYLRCHVLVSVSIQYYWDNSEGSITYEIRWFLSHCWGTKCCHKEAIPSGWCRTHFIEHTKGPHISIHLHSLDRYQGIDWVLCGHWRFEGGPYTPATVTSKSESAIVRPHPNILRRCSKARA